MSAPFGPRMRFALSCACASVVVVLTLFTSRGIAASSCTAFASPSGSDATGDGTLANPYASVGKLDASLSPGQTGCLETGTYGSTSTEFYLTNSGTAGGQITITSYRGEQAKVIGFVDLMASYTTLSGLEIDGSNTFYTFSDNFNPCNRTGAVSQALEINGNDDIFEDNNYYQSVPALRGTGIGVGFNGTPRDPIIRYNRVHDVGSCMAYDHLIYLDSGNGAQIYDNWIYNDPHGFGVQVYPHASGAHIFDNVIDRAGSGITIGGTSATSNNIIDHNVITNATGLPDAGLSKGVGISSYWPGTPGTGNVFSDNHVSKSPGGIADVVADNVSWRLWDGAPVATSEHR
jgi:hypothetical protein